MSTICQLKQFSFSEQMGHLLKQLLENIQPVLSIRNSNLNLFIKSSRSSECSIYYARAICGPKY